MVTCFVVGLPMLQLLVLSRFMWVEDGAGSWMVKVIRGVFDSGERGDEIVVGGGRILSWVYDLAL